MKSFNIFKKSLILLSTCFFVLIGGISISFSQDWYRYQGAPDSNNPSTNQDCGPTCVAMAIQYQKNQIVTIKEISNVIGHIGLTNLVQLEKPLKHWSINFQKIKGSDQVLEAVKKGHIVITPVSMNKFNYGADKDGASTDPNLRFNKYRTYEEGHFFVVKGISSDQKWIVVNDPLVFGTSGDKRYWYSNGQPKGKDRYYSIKEFESALQTHAIEIVSTAAAPICTDGVEFVSHVTIPDNTQMQPNQGFTKTWRLRNTGSCSWGSGYSLVFVGGSQMGAPGSVSVPSVPQNGTADISVPMIAPSSPGTYQGNWQMRNPKGQTFGQQIWVKINVVSAPQTPVYNDLKEWLFKNQNVQLTGNWNIKDSNYWSFLKDCRHTGIDFAPPEGTSVYSATDGVVIRVEHGRDCRKDECLSTVAIYNESTKITFLYLHMKDINININQKVNAGNLIGKVGQRGYVTGPHLHFESRPGKQYYASLDVNQTLNPYEEAKKARQTPTSPPPPPIISPTVSMAPPSGSVGTTFTQTGKGFSPNRTATIWGRNPDGSVVQITRVNTDSAGSFTSTWVAQTPGNNLARWAVDDATGKKSNEIVFNVTPSTAINQPPNSPTNLSQMKASGAGIVVGASINENTVVFKGMVSDPNNDTVKLQIELRRFDEYGGQFTGNPTQESPLVSSGSTATITVSGLINANYHWRARTVDSKGAMSQWVSFGGNPDSAADFVVSVGVQPPPISQLSPAVIDAYNRSGGASLFGESLPQNYTTPSGVASTNIPYKAVELSRGGIYESSKGVFVVYGAIYQKYRSLGGPRHYLGLPTGNEGDAPRSLHGTTGRISRFERGSINWLREKNQTFLVQGAIFDKWASLGYSGGQLGFPVSDEYPYQGGARSDFEGGWITWTSQTGAQVAYKTTLTPTLTQTPLSGTVGTTFTQKGSGFTPNRTATIWGRNPDGSVVQITRVNTDSTGSFTSTWTAQTPGNNLARWAVDDTTGQKSNEIVFHVTSAVPTVDKFPNVTSFSASSSQINQGQSITLSFSVVDDVGLSYVRLMRADDSAKIDFREIRRFSVSGGSYIGSFTDTPPSAGTYRYGLHVVDTKGQWNCERNSQSGFSPGVYGPRQVVVVGAPIANPQIQVSTSPSGPWSTSASGQQNTVFYIRGSGFSPNAAVRYHVRKPDGTEYPPGDFTGKVDGAGNFNHTYTSQCTTVVGTYTVWVIDKPSGKSSNTITEQITKNPNCK